MKKEKIKILVADDEQHQRTVLNEFLQSLGHEAILAANGNEALQILKKNPAQIPLAITDLDMPELSGIELIKRARTIRPDTEFLVLTAHGSIDSAIEAMKTGASDYLTKPVEFEELTHRITKVLKLSKLQKKAERLEFENRQLRGETQIVGETKSIRKLISEIEQVSKTNSTVLVLGETGVGKEVVARYLHEKSDRSSGPFIAVNCSAIPETLIESEFFGHEKGAFTGADKRSNGFFEQAEGGTLFLDEIGEMNLKLQPKILRVLENRAVRRIGGTTDIPVDVRLVTATHRDLKEMVTSQEFREDLFYRLNVVQIQIPPLRERIEDIPLLVQHLARRSSKKINVGFEGVSPDYLEALKKYKFPGNIRELANIVERSLIYMKDGLLTNESLPAEIRGQTSIAQNPELAESYFDFQGKSLNEILGDFEKKVILKTLAETNQDVDLAAKNLQVSRSTLYSKISKHGIK